MLSHSKSVDNDNTPNQSSLSTNWIEKLKPSSKNKLICKKYKNLSTGPENTDDLSNYGISDEILPTEEAINSTPNSNFATAEKGYQARWNKCVKQSKFQMLHIDVNNSEGTNENHNDKHIENSFMSENMEEINNIIEEKYKMVMSENMFLRQENHSIIPFLLISNREIHRMCLSDYEIKTICRSFKSKSKSFKLEAIDYYRTGLIYFYRGKYINAYQQFKNANKLNDKDQNISKWLAFTILIIIFCENGKLDFSHMRQVKWDEEKLEEMEGGSNPLFSCCSSRKTNIGNKTKSIPVHINSGVNDYGIQMYEKLESLSHSQLAKECLELLNVVLSNNSKSSDKYLKTYVTCQTLGNKHMVNHEMEAWWLMALIGSYRQIFPEQMLFNEKYIYDPKYCIKKIKEKDDYLSYIAYAEYNYLVNENYSIDKLLKQLMSKYSNKIEAYLRYWQLLTKGKYQNYELANSISEVYWKNSSTINFDDSIY
jgi:hypothetical protein